MTMSVTRNAQEVTFMLRFYEQTSEAILKVVKAALQAHPSITGWSQLVDHTSEKSFSTVILKFRDRASMEAFSNDREFADVYLANAWGKRAMNRDSLRTSPPNADDRGTIPGDMFAHVGF
jgi:hypothetical protein